MSYFYKISHFDLIIEKQMHERVAILNGTIHFYSEEGFRTVVEIPKIGGKKDD